MRRVAMVGAGMTQFGELFHLGMKDMLPMAISEAIDSVDKGFERTDIQAVWFGNLIPSDGFSTGIVADYCGLMDVPISRVENACATGNVAVRHGFMAIAGGHYDVVLVVGADKVRETPSSTTFWEWAALTRDSAWDFPLGLIAPSNFALHANRWLHESGNTREHLAMVAVKNHHNGVSNPKAQLRNEITIEQVLNAPIIADPFGLYDCCPQSDGAAAVLLVAEHLADKYTDKPVWVRGAGLGLDRVMHAQKTDLTTFPATVKAARIAYAQAGLTAKDIHVAEVHDCFTGVELIDYEDLGFCEKFGAGKMIESGAASIGGRLPTNPSGGLKAKGHPPGATGVAQCLEIYQQLRGEAHNQVEGAVNGLTHNIGGPTAAGAVVVLSSQKG
ncbi:unannotated protein [freshwater metagenome]|uniref:Unannotated protein n=1 Tax=freshwater metagenome TaxID=449393 RepID=A0A6J6ZY57_9ZZZZ|nr:thiolase family protein [Actinomycetota bacterium]